VFREVALGAKTDRAQLRRLLDQLEAGDVLTVTRLDRLVRSTRDLLNTLAAITAKKAGFPVARRHMGLRHHIHGRLMLTVLGGLAEFERDLIRARSGARTASRDRTNRWHYSWRRRGLRHTAQGSAAVSIGVGTRVAVPEPRLDIRRSQRRTPQPAARHSIRHPRENSIVRLWFCSGLLTFVLSCGVKLSSRRSATKLATS
jgi:hypothetical protein